MVLETN